MTPMQINTLESLDNALFLDLFEFLNATDLLRAFRNLNPRIESLLYSHLQAYRIDLRFGSKKDFNDLCDEHLAEISDRTISLRLSNDDDTPQQLQSLFLHDNLLSQFTHLRSFTLYHVFSEEIMRKISCELKTLSTLTRLNIIQCYLPNNQSDNLFFIDHVWNLPKLVYFKLDVQLQGEETFRAPRTKSSSIRYVTIKDIFINFIEINHLFVQTPHMSYLESRYIYTTGETHEPSNILSLSALNLSFVTIDEDIFATLFQQMSSLRRLTISLYDPCVDGHQWEQIIRNYLPNLKIFQLLEQISIIDLNYVDEKVEALLKTFQTEFWLNERQWFIQCNWILTDSFLSLYTLPYSFAKFNIGQFMISKSTRPQNSARDSYHQVNRLLYNPFSDEDEPLPEFCFPFIRHLSVESPLHRHFGSILPKLDRLTSIKIYLSDVDSDIPRLQILLNLSINLLSLTITASSLPLMMSLISDVNSSVRRLNLQSTDQWFDQEQCMILIESRLTSQCELLTMSIQSCIQAPDLVENMINLRALKIRCEDDQWEDFLVDTADDCVIYLKRCFESAHVERDAVSHDYISIWIH